MVRAWALESLEDRVALSTITVLNTNNDGGGSLRAAIVEANALPGPDTINFAADVHGTITLSSVLPDLSTDITIDGPGASVLTVAHGAYPSVPQFGIFTVATGAEVALSGLSIVGGLGQFAGGAGGGIKNAGSLTVADSILSRNSASIGGGIDNTGTLTVTHSTISGNSGGTGGAGIENGGTMTVVDSNISDNLASSRGAGIENRGTMTVADSNISDNSVILIKNVGGGGIFNAGTMSIVNSTFNGNSAAGLLALGGAIHNEATMSITNSTLSGNSAREGGGIYNVGTLRVATSILASNPGGNLDTSFGTLFLSGGRNLFSDAPGVPLDPTDLINTDPLLAPLADNGGPTLTQALLPGSPAIDAGIALPGIETDQRGIPRPQGTAPDIGAFESRGFTLNITSGDGQSTPAASAFLQPLVVTIASPFGEPTTGGQVRFIAPTAGASALLSLGSAPIDSVGQAEVTAVANAIGGTYAVNARTAGAPDETVAFTLTNLAPTLVLTPPTGPNLVSQAGTITATLLNTDERPLTGIPVSFDVTDGPDAGASGAIDPASGKTDANGQVRFTYKGNGGPGTDTIVATAQIASGMTISSPGASVVWTLPPSVIALRRYGFHAQPTSLVVTFSAPLDPSRAVSLANYQLVRLRPSGRRGPALRLRAAVYHPATLAVTINPARRLPLHDTFLLTINGTTPGRLTDTFGTPLDGLGNGLPGSNYVRAFGRDVLAGPSRTHHDY